MDIILMKDSMVINDAAFQFEFYFIFIVYTVVFYN